MNIPKKIPNKWGLVELIRDNSEICVFHVVDF